MKATLSKLRKRKKRKRRIVPVKPLNPDMEINPATAPIAQLTDAYAIGCGWDNADDAFIAELSDFGVEVHGSTRAEATALALEAQRLLIEVYRVNGYTLPSL
jgi:predicted RNase H-like HicB family nuclease